MQKDQKQKKQDPKPTDNAGVSMTGHVLIRDKETKETVLNKRNAIHYGNMAFVIADSLNNGTDSIIYKMLFGNGATGVDSSGKVIYKSPRVSESFESSASLYSETYNEIISSADSTAFDGNSIEIIKGPSYTDIKMTCELGYNVPNGQDAFDSGVELDGNFVFDELGIQSKSGFLLTHVIFHPVQKSANRQFEIIYTIRIQLN